MLVGTESTEGQRHIAAVLGPYHVPQGGCAFQAGYVRLARHLHASQTEGEWNLVLQSDLLQSALPQQARLSYPAFKVSNKAACHCKLYQALLLVCIMPNLKASCHRRLAGRSPLLYDMIYVI